MKEKTFYGVFDTNGELVKEGDYDPDFLGIFESYDSAIDYIKEIEDYYEDGPLRVINMNVAWDIGKEAQPAIQSNITKEQVEKLIDKLDSYDPDKEGNDFYVKTDVIRQLFDGANFVGSEEFAGTALPSYDAVSWKRRVRALIEYVGKDGGPDKYINGGGLQSYLEGVYCNDPPEDEIGIMTQAQIAADTYQRGPIVDDFTIELNEARCEPTDKEAN